MKHHTEIASFADIVTESAQMKALVVTAKKFAQLDAPLLIQGETGTGKDLIAKACHQFSQRKKQRFIAINCAGLPTENAESEMFGHYSDTQKMLGFFEYADGGTVLLDNVEELSLPLQAKLLRFLNDGTFRRVGDEQERYSNVRVICTSQAPLQDQVSAGKVREDLFYRLNVLNLQIPPLRERKEDIPALIQIFLRQISQQLGISQPSLSAEVEQSLVNYVWLGNGRELYNKLYRACSLLENNQLTLAQLDLNDKENFPINIEQFNNESLDEIMASFESTILRKFYEQYPSTRKLATRLKISHTAIANKLRNYGINK